MSSNPGIDGLRSWIGEMQISPESKSLAKQYVDDLAVFVRHRPDSDAENHMLVSQARLLLGLWSRPESLGKESVETMLKAHEQQCALSGAADPLALVPKGKRELAVALAKVASMPAAWIVTMLTLGEPLSNFLNKLIERF